MIRAFVGFTSAREGIFGADSPFDFLVQTPLGDLKSGMLADVEIPAPV